MGLPQSKIVVTGSFKSFLFYVLAFIWSFMLLYSFGLKWFGLPFAVIIAFGFWYIQNRHNPGAIKYYLIYLATPKYLDGNLFKNESQTNKTKI